jgi:transcription elongation GreA/GreB family factor
MDAFKQKVLEQCKAVLRRKTELVAYAMDELSEAMTGETKSSVGDKHETARAKMQAEQEKLSQQLVLLRGQAAEIARLDLSRPYTAVSFGCLVETNRGRFFTTVALGRIEVEEKAVFVISLASPLGKKLFGLKQGDSFSLNDLSYSILAIS